MIKYDMSTINRGKLELLRKNIMLPSYQLQRDLGNCCFLDPPGYPSYFTQSIYNKHGNEPSRGATKVLSGKVIESRDDWDENLTWNGVSTKRSKLLRSLWIPLPIDHPRTKEWTQEVYSHLRNCYHDEGSNESDKILIYPVPSYKLESFVDDKHFSDEWRIKERAVIDQMNSETIANAMKVATPENHKAVRWIQKFYPEYQPDKELIKNPPKYTTTWWERYSECPTPENCPGGMGKKHPLNDSWCQVCGWHKEE